LTEEKIIELAQEAGLKYNQNLGEVTTPFCDGVGIEELQKFAKLVVASIDPSKFMSYQEGYEAGRDAGRAEQQADMESLYAMYQQACKQRDILMDQQRAQIAAMRGQLQ